MFGSHKHTSVRPLRRVRRLASKHADKKTGKPVFETLEERQHFSVVTVTTTADSGAGSLRSAIQAVDAGKDNTIDFDIPKSQESAGMWNIDVKSALPTLTKSGSIDGWSQPGYKSTPVIELNGLHTASAVVGLDATGGKTTVRGLSFDNFSIGVEFNDSKGGDVVKSSTFGKHVNDFGLGTAILLRSPGSAATGNIIVMSGNTTVGVRAAGNNDTVTNNNITGSADWSGVGVWIEGVSNIATPTVQYVTVANNTISTVGTGIDSGDSALDGTISYNHLTDAGTGILLENGSQYNAVLDNVVTGSPNAGIEVDSNLNTIGEIGSGNTVTQTGPSLGDGDGIDIYGSENSISGNTSTNNGGSGIYIGYISGANNYPIDNTVQGNTLNGNFNPGISLAGGATENLIGGDEAGQGNIIDQPFCGISEDSTCSNNAIEGNSISADEGYYGISGNGLPQAPVITGASAPLIFGAATVTGTVHASPFSTVHVELFASTAESQASGLTPVGAEGQTYLGYVNVTTNASGNATFSDKVARTAGESITATAMVGGATSEFSAPVTELAPHFLPLPIHLI